MKIEKNGYVPTISSSKLSHLKITLFWGKLPPSYEELD
jgi:hypothetical protein